MPRLRRAATLAVAASCLVPVVAAVARGQTAPAAGAACPAEGVWELVSVSVNGTQQPNAGFHQRKIVARGHFMWVGEDMKRDTLPLRTLVDSLRASRVLAGAGTYTTAGNTYTERLEYFFDPTMIGQSLDFACRIAGDRWYHDRTYPADTTRAGSQPTRIAEVWRRVK